MNFVIIVTSFIEYFKQTRTNNKKIKKLYNFRKLKKLLTIYPK